MSRRRKWTDEQLREAVRSCTSAAAVMRSLGVHVGGANYQTINRRISELGLETVHWLGQAHLRGQTNPHVPTRALEEILRAGSRYNTNDLRTRLIKTGIFQAVCSHCRLTEWLGHAIPLELDHVDGDRENNELSNLRLLCPNCHALTPTYRGRNKKCAHIPSLSEIHRGIEQAGGLARYAARIGVSREVVRGWLKSARLHPFSGVEEQRAEYSH